MAFPRFSELPFELQDLVWEFYIPNPPLAAHFVRLKCGKKFYTDARPQGIREAALTRRWDPDNHTEPYLGLDRTEALRNLLQISRRSRAVALRKPDALEPLQSMILEEGRPEMVLPGQIPCPALRINVATDLVIFNERWRMTLAILSPRGYSLRNLKHLRYLALESPGGVLMLHPSIIKVCRELRGLYLLIDPNKLRMNEEPGADDVDWSTPFLNNNVAEACLAEYAEGEVGRGPFRYGGQEYFEVSARQLLTTEGVKELIKLHGLAHKAETWRADSQRRAGNRQTAAEGISGVTPEWGPQRLRFMSWRDVSD
ncbi:hypothetical protein FQN54_006223 [Arachnomyces sp. PD_36]|nr:hypothetical protein FQN54_006223 [Arachnomyces sp. PD_36]